MNYIRFSPINTPPETPREIIEVKKEPKIKGKFPFKKIAIAILVILFVAILAVAFKSYVAENGASGGVNLVQKTDPNASSYYAVFLSNGQVYFGEIVQNNTNEMVLAGAYRMQPSGQTYTLLKLTDEAYGSTDKIFINRSQILFYEQLRSDSQVVKLIEQQGR